MSALWNIENSRFTQKLTWDEEEYVEFPNLKQDKVLATTGEVCLGIISFFVLRVKVQ